MSRANDRPDLSDLPPPICHYCGLEIEEPGQQCMARDEGVCRP